MTDHVFSCDYEDALSGQMRADADRAYVASKFAILRSMPGDPLVRHGAIVPNRIAELEAQVARLTEQLAALQQPIAKVEPHPIFRAIRNSRG